MPAGYYRGFLVEANTNNATKILTIRDADTGATHQYSGPAGNGVINHNGQSQIEYSFTPPFVAHLVREEPANDGVQWQNFGIKWLVDPWPELSVERSAFMNLGTAGAKYITSTVLPLDTGNNNVSLIFQTSDGNSVSTGPFVTPANAKTPQPIAFSVPFIAHEIQILPQNNVRMWPEEANWNFEPWPELLTESSFWFNAGTPRAKYFRGGVLPIDTNGSNVSYTVLYDGNNSTSIGPFNTPAGKKTPVKFPFLPFVGHEFQLTPSAPCRTWWQEAQWDQEVWPELIAEYSPWMNLGTPGAKYMRGVVVPVETGGAVANLSLISSDGSVQSLPSIQTSALVKTPTAIALSIPLVGHEFQFQTNTPIRIWFEEARWDFDPWPELITEATGWLPVLPGGAAAFLQGLLIPVEAAGAGISLTLLTDVSPTPIPLIATRTPLASVKTPIPYALSTPVVCHQVQIVPSAPCRIWTPEIQWIAEATPELASTWTTQPTSHGMSGYHSILRIEAAYSASSSVTLNATAFDGTSPATITLPSTGGVKQKILITPTFNKGQLYTYSATSASPFQMFNREFIVWVGQWGRSKLAVPYNLLGGAFDDKAVI